MRLIFRHIDTLPRLAWCAKLIRGEDHVQVFHGPWVETANDFFCEGAWSGDYLSQKLDTCILMGSGGRTAGNRLLIATPNNTLERLFALNRHGKTLFVSNCFAFVLAAANDNVDPQALLYSVKLASITHGLKGYARFLPTRDGHKVRLYYHCNLLIDSKLNIIEEPKKTVREFVNFADYKAFLLEQVAAIHANANDPHRKVAYRPIASVSAGYDSPAAAVLAQRVGCAEALTFTGARGAQNIDDSGVEIAGRLGMQVHLFDRLDYLQEKNFPEAEFFGYGALELPWAAQLEGKLLFTGFHGDKVWDRNNKKVSPHIVRGDPSGHNLNPFRLRVGWIHIPVPFIGCTSHPAIHRISNSEEMKPWTLNNNYDRPIPRRLLEEAGVERHIFGMKKRAAGLNLPVEGLKERMTKESLDDYMKYYREHWNVFMTMKQRLFLMLRRFNMALQRRHWPTFFIPREIRIGPYGDLDELSLLMHWSTEKIMPRYNIRGEKQ